MPRPPAPLSSDQAAARRRSVRRTAWLFAAIAVAIYVAFLLSGVLGR